MRKTALMVATLAALPFAVLAQANPAVTSYEFQRHATDGVALRLASLDLRSLWNGAIGPQAGYEHARVGLAAAHDLDAVTTLSAALVTAVDSFGDDVFDGERRIGNGFTVYSGLRLDRVEGMIGRTASVESHYGFGQGVFLDGRADYARFDGGSRQTVAVGVGFSF